MCKLNHTVLLNCLLVVLPLLANAQITQTCYHASIPSTTPTSQFTDNSDGTVTDTKTGLMWKKCAEGQEPLMCSGSALSFNWQEALQRAQDVNAGTAGSNLAYADWRVPNIKELASIVEESCLDPAINTAIFPNISFDEFWSSSPRADYNSVWHVSFNIGYSKAMLKDDDALVRLVRGGQ